MNYVALKLEMADVSLVIMSIVKPAVTLMTVIQIHTSSTGLHSLLLLFSCLVLHIVIVSGNLCGKIAMNMQIETAVDDGGVGDDVQFHLLADKSHPV